MIIDVHYHFMPRVNEQGVAHTVKHALRAAEMMGIKVDPDELSKKAVETWGDPDGERLLALMDEAGIDLTLICMVDNMNNPLLTPEMMQRGNKRIGEVAQRYPERVMALAGVDPRRPEAADLMKQCFEEFGVKGLKYHPDHGYDPSGPDSYKVLEIVAQNNGILLTHTGPLMPPSRCKFADPSLLADLGVDFPGVKIIAAHMGAVEWRSWANLAAHQPNLYGDMAMWDSYAFGNYKLFCRELRDILDYAGANKVLFGTDNPIFNTVKPTKDYIQLIKDLPNSAPAGIEFTKEEVNAILGGNAASMLGLKA
ncbi:MAG: amidohydrolase [Deltaproteobacteria bacterium]|nr:amidohydrolase [Deltaproteobacteria bacterium]MBW2086677.1 amidohydrolase [Deltaproteobacteria bacterium]